jgi:hypothetical protein
MPDIEHSIQPWTQVDVGHTSRVTLGLSLPLGYFLNLSQQHKSTSFIVSKKGSKYPKGLSYGKHASACLFFFYFIAHIFIKSFIL